MTPCGRAPSEPKIHPAMKTCTRRGRAAFTLMEIMAVITIIIILAGLTVGGMSFVAERQKQEKAKVQLALLENAIESYKADMGDYPGTGNSPESGDVSEDLYNALFKDGYDYTSSATPPTNWTKATKIYLPELDPRSSKQGWVAKTGASTPPASLKITDPWKNNFRYRKGTNAQNPTFDLWSYGKDGKHNATSLGHADNRDDVRNF